MLVELGWWKSVKLKRQGVQFSHLFFADDIMLVGEVLEENALIMKEFINLLGEHFGEKSKWGKIQDHFSNNVDKEVKNKICDLVGFREDRNMGKYIGFNFEEGGNLKSGSFNNLVEKIQSKLTGWKSKHLSMAGRHVFIKSVPQGIANYYL